MTTLLLVGVRIQRHGPILLAEGTSEASLPEGELVLIEVAGALALAQVAVPAERILAAPPGPAHARIVAVGAAHPRVAAVVARQNADALARIRRVAGSSLPVASASWGTDGAQLTVFLAAPPPLLLDEICDRLALEFRAQIRFRWPTMADGAPRG